MLECRGVGKPEGWRTNIENLKRRAGRKVNVRRSCLMSLFFLVPPYSSSEQRAVQASLDPVLLDSINSRKEPLVSFPTHFLRGGAGVSPGRIALWKRQWWKIDLSSLFPRLFNPIPPPSHRGAVCRETVCLNQVFSRKSWLASLVEQGPWVLPRVMGRCRASGLSVTQGSISPEHERKQRRTFPRWGVGLVDYTED